MVDHKGIPGFKRRSSQREKAATYFLSMLPPVVEKEKKKEEEEEKEAGETKKSSDTTIGLLATQLEKFPCFRTKLILINFLAKGPANDFALFDVEGEGCGSGFFPLAALSNHSCLPSSAVQIEGTNMVR